MPHLELPLPLALLLLRPFLSLFTLLVPLSWIPFPVVAPCWLDDHHNKELSQAPLVYEEALSGKERRYLLYFGGSIRHGQVWELRRMAFCPSRLICGNGLLQFEYSGGARQAFDKHVISKHHPEVVVGGGPERYR